MGEPEFLKLMPSEEKMKPLDEIVKKFDAQELRIPYLDYEAHTRLGRLLNLLSPPPIDSLPSDFAQAVREYKRLKLVVKDNLRDYEQNPDFENRQHLQRSILSFHEATKWLNNLYYQALGAHRVDEGLGKQVEELEAKNQQIQADLRNAKQRILQLETYIRIHGLNPDDANDTIVSDPFEGGGGH